MSHEHYVRSDSRFYVPKLWRGLAAEVPFALPMPSPDAAGGVGVSYPAQNGVIRELNEASIEIEDKGRLLCIPKSRIWALSVLDDGEDRLSGDNPDWPDSDVDATFEVNGSWWGQEIDIALAMPTGIPTLGGRSMRIEYPRQAGTIVKSFPTSVVLRYAALVKGEKQQRLMLLPKARIWTVSRAAKSILSV